MSESAAAFSFCLSAAAILRCPSLTQIQHIIIIIPTVLEVLFSSSLIWTLRKSGQKRHLLLSLEGWFYLILSIFNLLSHILPAARTNVDVFSGFDMTVGVASFVPLFLYTFFLYIYTNAELLSNNPSLPRLLGRIGSLVLLFSIPAIIVANEVASFSGVRRIVVDGRILIGFDNRGSYTINAFFSSLTLALLTLFQAIVFLIAFFRVIKALMNQRKYQSTGRDANHMVRGMAWLSAGMKLGVIETLIGFAGGGFYIVIARRFIRFVTRAFLCVGVSKGVDEIEDFRAVRKEMLDSARSKFFQGDAPGLRAMISNPRASTFQRLSPTAKTFYNLPRAHLLPEATFDYNKEYNKRDQDSLLSIDDERRTLARMRSLQELEGIAVFANLKDEVSKKPKERVTIGYRDSSGAPTLLLRLSSGKFPSPTGFIQSVRSSISASNKFQKMPDSPEPQYTATFTFAATQGEKAQQEYRRSEAVSAYSTDTMGADYITLLRPNVSVLANNPPRMYRDSSTPSVGPSITDSGIEIVNAPQRKVSQTTARALLYNVNHSAPSDAPIAKGSPKPIFTSQFTESPVGYQLSSDSVVPDNGDRKVTGQFRVSSDYSSVDHSGRDTLETVRQLTKQFPQTPVTFNGRPLMGGLGQNIYDSSAPTSPTAPMDRRRSRSMVQSVASSFHPPSLPPTAVIRGGSPGRQVLENLKWKPTPSLLGRGSADLEVGGVSRFDTDTEYDPSFVVPPMPSTMATPMTPTRPRLLITTTSQESLSKRHSYSKPGSFISVTSAFGAGPNAYVRKAAKGGVAFPRSPSFNNMSEETGRTGWSGGPSPYPLFKVGSTPASPQELGRPLSDVDVYTLASPMPDNLRVEREGEGAQDPFDELAVRTGGSTDLRKSRGVSLAMARSNWPRSGGGLPTPPAEHQGRRLPSKVVWLADVERSEGEAGDKANVYEGEGKDPQHRKSVDSERRRQYSIDAAAQVLSSSIPWLKYPEIEAEERELARAIKSGGLGVGVGSLKLGARGLTLARTLDASILNAGGGSNIAVGGGSLKLTPRHTNANIANISGNDAISRIKSVGNVKSKVTPLPTHPPTPTRGSLYIEPIMVPRRSMFAQRVEVVGGEEEGVVDGEGLRDGDEEGVGGGAKEVSSTGTRTDSDVFGGGVAR